MSGSWYQRAMMKSLSVALSMSLGVAATAPAQRSAPPPAEFARALAHPRADYLRAHLAFLADDMLEGRAPATRGGQLAARYIAAQFEAAGLAPGAGGNSFFQPDRKSVV